MHKSSCDATGAAAERVAPATIDVLHPPALTPLVWLDRAALIFANRIAVIDGDRCWNWAQFAHRCRSGASVLVQHGVVSQDRVGVLGPNSAMVLEAQYAIPAAEAIIVNLNPRLSVPEIAHIIDHSQMRVLLVDVDLHDTALEAVELSDAGPERVEVISSHSYDSALADMSPLYREIVDELAPISINYTSGTTGTPKGVVVTHRSVYLQALAMSLHLRLGLDSVYLWTLPMIHANGWAFVWAVSAIGCPSVILRRPSPAAVFESVSAHGVTHLCAAPTVLNSLVSYPRDELPGSLTVAVGGSPPSPALLARTRRAGWSVVHLYGLTETGGPAVICLPLPEWDQLDDEQLAAAMTRQGVPNVVTTGVATADATGSLLPVGAPEPAEIVVQGQSVFAGYLRDQEATAAALHGRWLRTGDVGRTDAEGYVHLLDRQKDIIISGGENISSVEVERLLDEHPVVLESAVVAVPDEHWGEVPVAVVTLRTGINDSIPEDQDVLAERLIEHVKRRTARFKAPRSVVFGPLPKGETGKVLKHELRIRLREQEGTTI